MMRFIHYIIVISLFPFCSSGQLGFEYNASVPVIRDGNTLANAWAGGLDYAQFSTIDYDFDGDLDLFVFDRSTNNIRLFSNETTGGQQYWKFVYNATSLFPTDLIYRATMVDFDNDGRNDLFTYSIGGLKVYRNIGDATQGLQWEVFKPIVYSDYNGFNTNLFVASSDIPAIADIDFDGDIDVLTFHQGGQHLEYHKNMSMENYGTADSLEFVLANECWGKFSENANNNSVLLNDTSYPCVGGEISNPEIGTKPPHTLESSLKSEASRHAGSTVLALDYNNSGVMDLILGDVAYENLVLLINGGTQPNTNSAMISADISFPSNTFPASIYLFPAPFYLDVDFDGVKDLLVGANAKNVSQNEASVLFYKNIGTNNNPTFIFQKNNFLQEQMIEHGKGSIPVLFDVDRDGLKDLLVSNFYRFKNSSVKESTIAWYKNTGTATQPTYTFIDYNWLNLNQQNLGLRLVPTFGDINNDGKDELILGKEDGGLLLFQNTGTTFAGNPTALKDNTNANIQVGAYSYPQLIDLNNDNLLDLVVGNKNGTIYYYQNIGTATTPSFQLTNSQLGNINLQDPNNPDTYASPHFFRQNDTLHLFLGSIDGKIRYYNDIENNLVGGQSFHLVNSSFLNINTESYSACWVEDINQNGNLNMLVGQDLGGLYHFEVDPNSTISIETISSPLTASIYPNPVTHLLHIEAGDAVKMSARLISVNGQEILSTSFFQNTQLQIESLENGLYLLELSDENGRKFVSRIIKQ